MTGLLLLLIGFLLIWVPDVSFVGDLLIFIGIIFLWLGRHEFAEPHPRNVVRGSLLVLASILLAVGLAIWFVAAIVGAAFSAGPSATPSSLSASITSALGVFVVGAIVLEILLLLGEIWIVYALADRVVRELLWAAFAAQMAISVILLAIIYPRISGVVQQSVNGTAVNTGPITAFQTQIEIYSLLNAIPALMFAYSFYQIRERLKREPVTATVTPA